jgi:hypothetical protein
MAKLDFSIAKLQQLVDGLHQKKIKIFVKWQKSIEFRFENDATTIQR